MDNANLYLKKYNFGDIHPLFDDEIECDDNYNNGFDDELLNDAEHPYIYSYTKKQKLTNGLIYTDMLIKDTNRMNMYKLKNELIEFGVNVIGYKVDYIFIQMPKQSEMKNLRK